jgi:uncharacterized paraquat-inducible protein A
LLFEAGGFVKKSVYLVIALLVLAGVVFAQAPKEPLKMPASIGTVTFDHSKHAAQKCDTCHHASKPAKPLKSPQEACGDCHTKTGSPEVPTKLQAAFHNPTATAGLCIDCHKKEAAAGKAAPTKCAECHKK